MSPLGRTWPARLLVWLASVVVVLVGPALDHPPAPEHVQALIGLAGAFILGDTFRPTGQPSAAPAGRIEDLVRGLPGQLLELVRARAVAPAAAAAPAAAPPRPAVVPRPVAPPPTGDVP